jgi:hypothetical protein
VNDSTPNGLRGGGDEQPCANDPSGLVRVIVHDDVVTIIDNRPCDTNPGPLPPHMLEQLRRSRLWQAAKEQPPAADT